MNAYAFQVKPKTGVGEKINAKHSYE